MRALWLSGAIVACVGLLVLPASARDACAAGIAAQMEHAGHVLSGTASNLLPPAALPPSRALAKCAPLGSLAHLVWVVRKLASGCRVCSVPTQNCNESMPRAHLAAWLATKASGAWCTAG